MIQLYGIGGLPRSGKDTIGVLIKYFVAKHEGVDMKRWSSPEEYVIANNAFPMEGFYHTRASVLKFAGLAKFYVSLATGVDRSTMESDEFKNQPIGGVWGDITGREMISGMMNGMRTICDDFHIRYLQKIFNNWNEIESERNRSFIVTDVRDSIELDWIQQNKGLSIFVHRKGEGSSKEVVRNKADAKGFKYKLNNNESINDLANQVEHILLVENIIQQAA